MTKNDAAWERLFQATLTLEEIQRNGFAYITATDLKKYGEREPRLMAKQDTLSVRPRIFKKHSLSIFPVRNGKYILFRDPDLKSYFDFGHVLDDVPVEEYRTSIDLAAFDSFPNSNFSESQAIDYAYLTSLISTFTRCDDLHLTIRGRLRSGDFFFGLPDAQHNVRVSGVQIEVDSGYENHEAILLIEAKVGKREDFHIRQLYYPYLEWSTRTEKQLIPIFLSYTNGKYYFTRLSLDNNFGDLEITGNSCYTINEAPVARINVRDILRDTPMAKEPDVPYPQANDLDRVIDLVKRIENGLNKKGRIADYFEFAPRQADYYANAGRYLGLLRKRGDRYLLTETGRVFSGLTSRVDRTKFLLQQMLTRLSIRQVFLKFSDTDFTPAGITKHEITTIIKENTGLTGTTPGRRASTILSWLYWLDENCDFR